MTKDKFKKLYRDSFTDRGLDVLFDWSKGKKIKCDDFTEYENILEFHKDYAIEDYPTHAHINDDTVLIMIGTKPEDKSFIIKNFDSLERRS
jgi:hypothetical protein